MMRDGLSDNAAHASCLLSPTNGVYFRHRDSAGATSTTTQTANTVVPPEWVRLVRAGDTFTSYHSEDGSAWTLIGTQTIAMPDTLNVGLAVTATNDAALCTASFTNVALTQPAYIFPETKNIAQDDASSTSS